MHVDTVSIQVAQEVGSVGVALATTYVIYARSGSGRYKRGSLH